MRVTRQMRPSFLAAPGGADQRWPPFGANPDPFRTHIPDRHAAERNNAPTTAAARQAPRLERSGLHLVRARPLARSPKREKRGRQWSPPQRDIAAFVERRRPTRDTAAAATSAERRFATPALQESLPMGPEILTALKFPNEEIPFADALLAGARSVTLKRGLSTPPLGPLYAAYHPLKLSNKNVKWL